MENITNFRYQDVERILIEYVKDRTMNRILEGAEITASAPYGNYSVTISEKPELEETDGPDIEKEVETDG